MIIVQNVHKEFKNSSFKKRINGENSDSKIIEAVTGISFTCHPGRIFSLLGPNGAGKTTTLRMIATLLKPTSGSISVGGFDTVENPVEIRRRIGFLTGTTKLYDRLTPNELVKYYADLYGMDKVSFNKRKEELFTILEMNSFADRRISKLSSGMRQKVSIVRTIIHDPEIIIFDEPTIGLDVITSKNIIDLIRKCKEDGKTVVFSTHIMSEVSLLCDDLAIIHKGRLCFNAPYKEFHDNMKTGSLEEEFIRIVGEC
jgi:sodium transport system ATP-binding protein